MGFGGRGGPPGGGGFGRGRGGADPAARAAQVIAALDAEGRWLTPLRSTSHPYKGDSPATVAPGDFSSAQVGDDFDTSPYAARDPVPGISVATYVGNLSALIRFIDTAK